MSNEARLLVNQVSERVDSFRKQWESPSPSDLLGLIGDMVTILEGITGANDSCRLCGEAGQAEICDACHARQVSK